MILSSLTPKLWLWVGSSETRSLEKLYLLSLYLVGSKERRVEK